MEVREGSGESPSKIGFPGKKQLSWLQHLERSGLGFIMRGLGGLSWVDLASWHPQGTLGYMWLVGYYLISSGLRREMLNIM